jgi:hypothetical protein
VELLDAHRPKRAFLLFAHGRTTASACSTSPIGL